MKWIMVLLGLSLATVGAAGIDREAGVIPWLDLAIAMVAVAAGISVRAHPRLRLLPFGIGFTIVAIALIGITTSAPWWLLRWNLFLGVGFALDGLLGLRSRDRRDEDFRTSHA